MLGISPLSELPLSSLPLSSGASYSITAELGTFSFTGVNAGLKHGYKTGVTVGSFSLSGQTTGLSIGKKMPAAVRAYTLTGVNAALSYLPSNLGEYIIDDFESTPLASDLTWEKYEPTGTVTVTRETSNVTEGTYSWRLQGTVDNTHIIGLASPDASFATFTVDLSAYTYISVDIFVATAIDDVGYTLIVADSDANDAQDTTGGSASGAYTLLVDISSFTAKDQCYIFLLGQKATPSAPTGTADVYIDNLLGLAPLVNTLQAGKGTFALTGNAAGLRAAKKMTGATDSFALSGVSNTMTRGRRLPVTVGTFSMTGVDATFTAPLLRIIGETGSISVTGNSAGLKKGYKTSGGTGSFSLTGNSTTFSRTTRTLTADTASFSIVSPDVNLRRGAKIAAATTSFTLTGVQADFEKKTQISCNVGEITVFGNPPHLTTTGTVWESRSNRIDRHDIIF